MFEADSFKRPSPSPSRSSIRSDSKICRQPRVIQVNRDVATMVESGRQASYESRVPDWEPFSTPHSMQFRSRTFSDGFIPNTSQELLLGVDCDACLAIASQRQHCVNENISQNNFDLVCNCNVKQYNYLNYQPDIADQRGHSLNIYDVHKTKRNSGRRNMPISSHHSLDRKHTKSKTIGVSNYISKQLISYDPTNSLVQKIKKNLFNLKKFGGDTISKKYQNAVQLTELPSESTNSLKKLSLMSLTDKSHQNARKSNSYIFTSSDFHTKNDIKHNMPINTNMSRNVDQCSERNKKYITIDRRASPVFKMRSCDSSDDFVSRNSATNCQRKFSTLDNRNRCRSIPRQMSYNDFATERNINGMANTWVQGEDAESTGELQGNIDKSSTQTCLDSELIMLDASPRHARCHCTCEQNQDKKFTSFLYDYQSEKRTPPAPDVTRRGPGPASRPQACRTCKNTPWSSTGTTSSHSSTTTGSSSRFTVTHRRWCCVAVLVLVAGTACVAGPLALRAPPGAPLHERLRLAERLLHETPLIDGHNDLPWNIRKFLHNKIKDFKFDEDLRTISPWATSSWSHTDLPRLKQGRISAQFWAAYVPCDSQHRDAVQLTFEQIDLIQRLTDKYHPQMTLCTSASDIVAAHANHRLCSLVGVEGGHAIGGSLAVLRTLYQVGVRYLTLTSTCDTPWAECSSASEQPDGWPHEGLTPFGKVVVKEMNRLGMLVDLSHVSVRTMRDALAVSRAPVLFSHSSARALCNATRNVPDVVLRLLAANKGLVMVNFYASFLTCRNTASVHDAIAHINHIRDVAGVDSVGLGAGFDGINYTPQGLEDVSSYPLLFAELMEAGWSMEELRKLAGLNLLRVLGAAERVARELAAAQVAPYEDSPPRPPDPHNCSSQDL